MDRLESLWDWLTKSRYTLHLEAEVIRLREELRLWQNALLDHNGMPRITTTPVTLPKSKGKMLPSQWRNNLEQMTMPKEPKNGN